MAFCDLSRADLAKANLTRANLCGANLRNADLSHADVSRAQLDSANLANAKLDGAILERAILTDADICGASLKGANLLNASLGSAMARGADFSDAILAWSDLNLSDFVRARLRKADLRSANLFAADFAYVDAANADFDMAKLEGTTIIAANLRGVSLLSAQLVNVAMARTDVTEAQFGRTCLSDTDLGQVRGLGTTVHTYPSSIGVDTLTKSLRVRGEIRRTELIAFFRRAGVSQELIETLPGIKAKIKYDTCLISYGAPDLIIAGALKESLTARGVSCWFYDSDKTIGKRLWHEIEEQLDKRDRMIVVCSESSLQREAVKKEIDKQIDKNPEKLVPVSVDNEWIKDEFQAKWAGRDLKSWLLDRNYADFASKRFEDALEDLLNGLKRPRAQRGSST